MKQEFAPKGDIAMRPEAVGLTWPKAPRQDQLRSGVAVIKVTGPLEHRGGEWSWFESYEQLLGRVEGAFQHEDVCAIILDIDSPGGEVSGLNETVKRIRAMRAHYDKPLVAYADDEAYSAAYALACACDEIYLPQSGGVGSVGVLAQVCDRTEMTKKAGLRVEVVRSGTRKAEGHPDIPLTDGVIARVQLRVDALAKQFFALVAEVRPTNRKKLEGLQGACVYGQKAVNAGLADGVLSFDEVFSSLSDGSLDTGKDSAVTFTPDDRSLDEAAEVIMSFTALQKKVDTCLMALNDLSLSAADRKKANAAYGKAVAALTEAKVKKTYNKKTTETETEEDDGEEESSASSSAESSSSAASSGASAEEDEEEAEEEKKSKKARSAAIKAGNAKGLAAFVKSLTGQSSSTAAKQMLSSMHEQAQLAATNAAEIKKLKDAAVASERKATITSMVAAGQLKPAQMAWAETQTIASLKAFAKHTPAMFAPRQAPVDESVRHASGDAATGADGLTDFERKLCAEQGLKPEAYKAQRDGTPVLPKVN